MDEAASPSDILKYSYWSPICGTVSPVMYMYFLGYKIFFTPNFTCEQSEIYEIMVPCILWDFAQNENESTSNLYFCPFTATS